VGDIREPTCGKEEPWGRHEKRVREYIGKDREVPKKKRRTGIDCTSLSRKNGMG